MNIPALWVNLKSNPLQEDWVIINWQIFIAKLVTLLLIFLLLLLYLMLLLPPKQSLILSANALLTMVIKSKGWGGEMFASVKHGIVVVRGVKIIVFDIQLSLWKRDGMLWIILFLYHKDPSHKKQFKRILW